MKDIPLKLFSSSQSSHDAIDLVDFALNALENDKEHTIHDSVCGRHMCYEELIGVLSEAKREIVKLRLLTQEYEDDNIDEDNSDKPCNCCNCGNFKSKV